MYFFYQAEDGIRDLVRSRGLGDVYKRQAFAHPRLERLDGPRHSGIVEHPGKGSGSRQQHDGCLLYTSDAADERSSVDLGGRRIIKKKNREKLTVCAISREKTIKSLTLQVNSIQSQ